MQGDTSKPGNGKSGGAVSATMSEKDVDKLLTQSIRTLREARATWQNRRAAPEEVGTIVATQLGMLGSRFLDAARIIKSGGGR